jgi:MFS family permease
MTGRQLRATPSPGAGDMAGEGRSSGTQLAGCGGADAGTPFWALWLTAFLGYVAIGATIQVMPDYVHGRFSGSTFQAGLAVTVGFLATMLARPIAGRIADQRGPRGVVLGGAMLATAGGLGHLFAPSFAFLIAARLLLGAGEGALFTASIGWVLASTPVERRGRIAGRFGLSMWGGLTGGPILGAALVRAGGFDAVWIAASVLPAVGFLVLGAARHGQQRIVTRKAVPGAWLPRAAFGPGASFMFSSIGYGVLAACLVPRMAALALPGNDVALTVFGVAFLATRFTGSPLVDRFGPAIVLAASLLVEAVGLAGLALASTAAGSLLMTATVGAGLALTYPCYVALVTRAADPSERTTALGVVISSWDLGVALGGPLAGLLATDNYSGAFVTAAGASTISILILARLSARGR